MLSFIDYKAQCRRNGYHAALLTDREIVEERNKTALMQISYRRAPNLSQSQFRSQHRLWTVTPETLPGFTVKTVR